MTAVAALHPNEDARQRIARWQYRVSLPLAQIARLGQLIQALVTPETRLQLESPLRDIAVGSARIEAELRGLIDESDHDDPTAQADGVADRITDLTGQLEAACRTAGEVTQTLGTDWLRADLLSLSESLVRLRFAIASRAPAFTPPPRGPGWAVETSAETGTMSPFPTGGGHAGANLLLVDDDRINLKVIGRRLEHMGFRVVPADRGIAALELLNQTTVDLIMLDIMMPELDGFATLEQIKAEPRWENIPVIMLTALDDAESTARCLAIGADDYVSKPFDETVLRARIDAALDRKRLRDKERKLMERVRVEKNVSEHLLHSILPLTIANRLREGEERIVDRVSAATVLFVDIVGFTLFSATHEPEETVTLLNDLFSRFDQLVARLGLEKIKTIGDAYLAVAGVPELVEDHAARGARLALAVQGAMDAFNTEHGIKWSVRIGMNSGPLMAGIIGSHKFAYDLWGDTVNVASRLESMGRPDQIIMAAPTAALLGGEFVTESLGPLELHNRGPVEAYRLVKAVD